ncbi:MAG: nitronate monooxygenase [Thalassobaculum sp.]|uniref:NAD(P)H-dependent flavin oxidoreductase n=1 Tax=Thalassobaculum sp. TaxID=2022740 RepID=UPI0032ED1A78
MPVRTPLMQTLGLAHPIIQAPMAGGGDTPALVAAVAEAGGIGFLGAQYLPLERIGEVARAVRARTNRAFGVNLFAPQPAPVLPPDPEAAVARVAPFFAELGLEAPSVPASAADDFEDRLAALLETGASSLSFTMGLLPEPAMQAARARGMTLIGTATSVDEAVALERSGVDAIVAQGGEAGGHRGTFLGDLGAGVVGTMALVPQVVDAVSVPVIASGGIMDGRGIAAALVLGAQAVQMGTAFLTCDEAGVPEAYKAAILAAAEHQTRVTRAFSGRPARGIVNRFMEIVEAGAGPGDILGFPLQNALTRPMRTAAGGQGKADCLSLWAGQGVRLAGRGPASALMARLAAGTAAAFGRADG